MIYDLYAVDKNTVSSIKRVNLSSGAITNSIALPTGTNAMYSTITTNAARTRAWVVVAQPVSPYSNYVVTIDTTTDAIINTTYITGVSAAFTRCVLSPDETTLYITDGQSITVAMNTSTYALGSYHNSFTIAGVSVDNTKLYGQNSNLGEIVNASTFSVLNSWDTHSPYADYPAVDAAGTILASYVPDFAGFLRVSNMTTNTYIGDAYGLYAIPLVSPLGTYVVQATQSDGPSTSATFYTTTRLLAGNFTPVGSYTPYTGHNGVYSLTITPDDLTAYIIVDPGDGSRNLVTFNLSSMSVVSTIALGLVFSPISTGLVLPSSTNPIVMIV